MIYINLIPPEYIEKEKTKAAAGIVVAAVGLVLLTVGAFSVSLILKLNALEAQRAGIEKEVNKLEEVAREVDALEARKNSIQAKNGVVNRLLMGRFDYPALMESFAECLPPGQVAVRNLTLQKKTDGFGLTISAEGMSVQSVIQLLQRLESRPAFSNVMLGPITIGASGVNFDFTMDYKLQ